jgi:hypothetical protein
MSQFFFMPRDFHTCAPTTVNTVRLALITERRSAMKKYATPFLAAFGPMLLFIGITRFELERQVIWLDVAGIGAIALSLLFVYLFNEIQAIRDERDIYRDLFERIWGERKPARLSVVRPEHIRESLRVAEPIREQLPTLFGTESDTIIA